MLRLLIIFTILLACYPNKLFSCTILAISDNEKIVVGNNEDAYPNWHTRVWILTKDDTSKYGRIIFGFADGWAQGGMNEQGLFLDAVVGFKDIEWASVPTKPFYSGNLHEKILETAATIEEAVEIYKKYNCAEFEYGKIFLADRSGKSAILSFQNKELQVSLIENGNQVIGYGNKIANRMLKENSDITIKNFQSVLFSSAQEGSTPTLYTNIYDLIKGNIYIYDFRKNKNYIMLNLNEELMKGNHYYDLDLITQQINKEILTDSKCVHVSQARKSNYEKYLGKYKFDSGEIKEITFKDDNLLSIDGNQKHYKLYPLSDTEFSLKFVNVRIKFNIEIKPKEMTVYSIERDGKTKIKQAKLIEEKK